MRLKLGFGFVLVAILGRAGKSIFGVRSVATGLVGCGLGTSDLGGSDLGTIVSLGVPSAPARFPGVVAG